MEQISKQELIKKFILEDKERFLLATDIFENYELIAEDMLKGILESIIKYLNHENSWQLALNELGQLTNYYYFRINLNTEYYLQFECNYYFKTYRILLRCNEEPGFNPNDNDHNRMRQQIGGKYKEYYEVIEEKWYISGIKFKDYESNRGDSYMDLFEVYQNDKFRNVLCEQFSDRFTPIISSLLEFLSPQQ